ncbi:MAG: NAD-binding protein [Candidatus Coatesbacteria bacterium]|nr:NAD-binding protein [Candidatus Coatesbacteria bacterium]
MKVVIVGAGEVGFHIASRLAYEHKDVVVIDIDPEAIRRVSDNIDVQAIIGSGSSPVVLTEAGIQDAEMLLTVTNSDDTNLAACLVADTLSSSVKKLARLRDADYEDYHNTFRDGPPHIETIINPEVEVVKTIDGLMSVPGAVDVGEFADGRVKFIGINLDRDSKLAGARLSDIPAKIGRQSPLIAAVVRGEELIIPRGKDKLIAGDLIYMAAPKNLCNEEVS